MPGIKTAGQLICHTELELMRWPRCGRKAIAEIKAWCAERGVALREGSTRGVRTYDRPQEPRAGEAFWYRGWECGFEPDRHNWCGDGWVGYKGGCDLDAPQTSGKTWDALLDEIDAEEDEQ